MAKTFNRAVKLCGEPQVVGASKTSLTILEYDTDSMISRAIGNTVPTDGDAGYAVGCVFVDTVSGAGATFYVNEGSATVCDFNVTAGTATGDITSVVAGAGMTGGGVSGDVTLNVINTDGKITVGANSIDIAADKLVDADINSAAAIAYSKLAALASANVLIGSAGNVATVTPITGDVTLTNAGLTTVTDLTITNEAQGDILYRSAASWVRLAAGTSGYYLKTQGAGANPVWSVVNVGTADSVAQNATLEDGGANDAILSFTQQTVSAPTLTIPNFASVSDTFAFLTLAQTMASKTLKTSCIFGDAADVSKAVYLDVSGATAATKTTLTFAQTANRIVAFPDAAGTVTLLGNTATGSGSVVLANTPTLITPVLGVATATTVNLLTITQPATGAVLTIAEGKTLTANNSITIAGTDAKTLTVSNSLTLVGADAKTINFGSNSIAITTAGDATVTLPVSGTLATLAGSETLAGKTLTTPIVNGLRVAVASKSGDYGLLATDCVCEVDTTGGNVTITLPAIAAGNKGAMYIIKKQIAANDLVIAKTGADTIDGGGNVTLTAQFNHRALVSDGTSNWIVTSAA